MSTSETTSQTQTQVPDFASVFARLKPHMSALDAFLASQIVDFEQEIREMADYCIDTSGKRIRPALVFLSGWNADGVVSSDLVRVAAVVEMVHLATLVHDDIMDNADIRRSRATATKRYGPEAAVLLGDALFAHALHLAAGFPTTEVCAAVAESTRKVCAGEIVQTLRRGSLNISRTDYNRVIDLKTAELFRVSCHLGARLGGFDSDFVKAAGAFGRHLGIAYQIYDDLVDFYGTEQRIGKTLGTDLMSGKLTLPLIVLQHKLPKAEQESLVDELCGRKDPDISRRVAQMAEFDVFETVRGEIEKELKKGEAALAEFCDLPPFTHLSSLGLVLRAQLGALKA